MVYLFQGIQRSPYVGVVRESHGKTQGKNRRFKDPRSAEDLHECLGSNHKQSYDAFIQESSRLNEEEESKKDWWKSVNIDKLCAMSDDCEYHEMCYAYWYFKDEIADAWMDSDEGTRSMDERECNHSVMSIVLFKRLKFDILSLVDVNKEMSGEVINE